MSDSQILNFEVAGSVNIVELLIVTTPAWD